MGIPRKYKDTMNLALDADNYLTASKFCEQLEEILNGKNFPSIPPNDRAKLLSLSAKISLYLSTDINASAELLKRSAKEQDKFIASLRKQRYAITSRRRSRRPTKKEKELALEIFLAETEYYRLELLRAQIVLFGAEPGSIVHSRNIVNQVREKIKEDSWKFRFILAYCLYVDTQTYRYAKTSQNLNSFDLNLEAFLSFVSNLEAQGEESAPKWITELVHEAWVWQAVQFSRREKYSQALQELLLIQGGSPYLSVYVRANVQICFIRAFKLGKLEEANESLGRLKGYDMLPDLKLMWYLSKVYCQKRLGKQSDEDYRENVLHLNQLIAKSGSLLKGAFKNEIEKLKSFQALA